MAKSRFRCRQCGTRYDAPGHISKRGLCEPCAIRNMRDNMTALMGLDEMGYARWVASWRAGCGAAGRPRTPYRPDA